MDPRMRVSVASGNPTTIHQSKVSLSLPKTSKPEIHGPTQNGRRGPDGWLWLVVVGPKWLHCWPLDVRDGHNQKWAPAKRLALTGPRPWSAVVVVHDPVLAGTGPLACCQPSIGSTGSGAS